MVCEELFESSHMSVSKHLFPHAYKIAAKSEMRNSPYSTHVEDEEKVETI